MVVNNTKTMCVLLSALGFSSDGYHEIGDKVEILVTKEALMYAMLSTEEDVQQMFGNTAGWQELILLWKDQ